MEAKRSRNPKQQNGKIQIHLKSELENRPQKDRRSNPKEKGADLYKLNQQRNPKSEVKEEKTTKKANIFGEKASKDRSRSIPNKSDQQSEIKEGKGAKYPKKRK